MEIKLIDSLSLPKLTNAYHESFLSAVKATIDQTTIEAVGIKGMLYDDFLEKLSAEQLIVNRPRSSVYSAQLDKLDKARDSYFRGIIYKLMAAQLWVTEGITQEIIDSIERNIIRVYPITITSEGASRRDQRRALRGATKDGNDNDNENPEGDGNPNPEEMIQNPIQQMLDMMHIEVLLRKH